MSKLDLTSSDPSASAADRVYDDVKELILTNALAGGELISEGEIAQRCEVSRTPVREAFLRLQAEGWMRLYPKRGALVVPVTRREVRDVVEARKLIEGHAVREVVAGDTAARALADALAGNVEDHRAVDPADLAAFARVDAEFHRLIVAAGDNAVLADIYTGLGERHRRMTTASVHRDPLVGERILRDHTELLTAIADRDAAAFDHILARHLADVHDLPVPHPHPIPESTSREGRDERGGTP
ncbi:GntR family transcriptional regulator [Gordonia sinesedis]